MPRDGARTLSDLHEPTLTVICVLCGRRGRYAVTHLIERHGDAKLPDLLEALTNCPKVRSASIHDRCAVRFERLK
jgi:hypothetical protein